MLIEKKVLYVAEAASLLGCCAQVVYQLIEAGNFKPIKRKVENVGEYQLKL